MPEETVRPSSKRDRGAEPQRAHRRARRQQFLELYDFSKGRGLEIGPLDAGVADESTDDVRYVDVFDRKGIVDHYANDTSVVLELIPEIDYPIYVDGVERTLAEAAAPGGPYDWVIASHVIEHVPDLISWLQHLAEVTADGAHLLLAVPDRRYCFDRHRPPTTTGQVLAAYEERHTRPSVRAVYDFFSTVVNVDTGALWHGGRPAGRGARIHDQSYTLAQVEKARAGEYVDCHVWTFTPESLLAQIKELRSLGLCDWSVERIDPLRNTVEFLAVLRRLPRGAAGTPVVDEPELASDLPDFLDDEWAAKERVQELRQKVRRLRTRNSGLLSRVEQLESSTRLRVGSAILAPASIVRRRFGRGRSENRGT